MTTTDECKYYRDKDKECDVWGIPCEMKDCYFKELKRLEQENEKLKHKIETILKRKKDNCTCEDCYNEGLWEGMAIGSYEEVARLKHTLQEIKEIAEEWLNNDWSCFHCRSNMDEKLKEILDFITKAEEE